MKKEQLFNRKTATLALLLVLAFTFVPSLRAQEYNKETPYLKSSGSIIREYKQDTNIVYSVEESFNGFLLVSETGIAEPVLKIREESYVSDFEIYNDTVYFCGSSYDALNMRFIGFTGYFGLSAFPTTAIRAYYLPQFKTLTRMELLHSANGGPMHIAMVGKREDGFPTIVDAIVMSPSTWNFYYSTGDGVDMVYDDVAVTSNYVVAATRNTTEGTGYIYYFFHPFPGYSFLNGISTNVLMDSNICSSIILESRRDKLFSSVCNILDEEHGQVIDVIDYDGMNLSHSHVIINANTHSLHDLKYNPYNEQLDVLTNTTYSGAPYSEIFHVNSKGCVGGHQYAWHCIRSIDYLYTDPNHFIASGYSGDKNTLYVYKYIPTRIISCPNGFLSFCSTTTKLGEMNWNDLHIRYLDEDLSHVLQGSDTVLFKIACPW